MTGRTVTTKTALVHARFGQLQRRRGAAPLPNCPKQGCLGSVRAIIGAPNPDEVLAMGCGGWKSNCPAFVPYAREEINLFPPLSLEKCFFTSRAQGTKVDRSWHAYSYRGCARSGCAKAVDSVDSSTYRAADRTVAIAPHLGRGSVAD
jgi:hypothetical protein